MGRKKEEAATPGGSDAKPRAPRVKRTLAQQLTELHASKRKEVERLQKRTSALREEHTAVERELFAAKQELEKLAKAAGIEEPRGHAAEG